MLIKRRREKKRDDEEEEDLVLMTIDQAVRRQLYLNYNTTTTHVFGARAAVTR